MSNSGRAKAKFCTEALLQRAAKQQQKTVAVRAPEFDELPETSFGLYLYQANLHVKPWMAWAVCGLAALAAGVFCIFFLSPYLVPLGVLGGAALPLWYIEGRVEKRAYSFIVDYPTILLATASSIKAGMTPYAALERSVSLLPEKSLVRGEVRQLLSRLRSGVSRDAAVRRFGAAVRQPDLELFRAGFLLVLEHGGRFAPTLERLALVCKNRTTLIHAAHVSTATMRMTAHILLLFTPLIIGIVAMRTKDFWDIILHDPVASVLGSLGFSLIVLSYGALMRMSNFKP